MRNQLKYWRHQFQMERKEFAEFLGQPYHQYTRWENNRLQPSLENLIGIWNKIKTKYPNANLQDLLEIE